MNKYRCHVTSKKSYNGNGLAATIRLALESGMGTLQSRGEEARFLCIAVAEGDEYVAQQFYKLQYTTAYNGSTVRCTATRDCKRMGEPGAGHWRHDHSNYYPLDKPIADDDWSVVAAGIAEDFLVRHLTRRLLQ